jgi:putative acetyltransferase
MPKQSSLIKIRAATRADAAAILAIRNLPGVRSGTLNLPYQSLERVTKYLAVPDPRQRIIVAEIDGSVIAEGSLIRKATDRMAHCGSLYIGVHDEYQGKGIGTALLAAIIEIADRWLNLQRLDLGVFTDNAPAITLYKKFGFEIEALDPQYALRDGRLTDCYVMARLRGALPPGSAWPSQLPHRPQRTTVTLRGAEPEDAEALAAIINLPNARRGTLRVPFTRPEELTSWLISDGRKAITAETGGNIVGFSALVQHNGRHANSGSLTLVVVHDDWIGRGVGRALLQAILDLADNWLGLRRLKLNVVADNLAAVALYRSVGFVELGRHRADDFCDGGFVDGLSMVRFPPNRPSPTETNS